MLSDLVGQIYAGGQQHIPLNDMTLSDHSLSESSRLHGNLGAQIHNKTALQSRNEL